MNSINSVTPLDHRGDRLYITHCPGGVSGYPRAWYGGQFPEFESSRMRTRIHFRGTFSCAIIDMRKARERELATPGEKIDDQWVLNPIYAQNQMKAITGGGGRTTPAITACMSTRSWDVEVCQKKKDSLEEERINQQSAAMSTSRPKQHKLICQLRTNTTACT